MFRYNITHHIWSLIFFPSISTVRILKSIPEEEEEEGEGEEEEEEEGRREGGGGGGGG